LTTRCGRSEQRGEGVAVVAVAGTAPSSRQGSAGLADRSTPRVASTSRGTKEKKSLVLVLVKATANMSAQDRDVCDEVHVYFARLLGR
jgi:hypothetical protein